MYAPITKVEGFTEQGFPPLLCHTQFSPYTFFLMISVMMSPQWPPLRLVWTARSHLCLRAESPLLTLRDFVSDRSSVSPFWALPSKTGDFTTVIPGSKKDGQIETHTRFIAGQQTDNGKTLSHDDN